MSKLGIASRKEADALIVRGRVLLDGKPIRSLGVWIDPKRVKIQVNGKPTQRIQKIYLALNKPAGVVTTHADELGRQTVFDFLPAHLPRLFPIGRLDKETSGLLLFTNDTRFGERVSRPSVDVPKTYKMHLDKALEPTALTLLQQPMTLNDGTTLKPAIIKQLSQDGRTCEITIHEGKNRQIRRMLEYLGYVVMKLKRVTIGGIRLAQLREGATRMLTHSEVASILKVR